jgi:hypothetical protein
VKDQAALASRTRGTWSARLYPGPRLRHAPASDPSRNNDLELVPPSRSRRSPPEARKSSDLSAWEAVPRGLFCSALHGSIRPDLQSGLSVSDRERAIFTGSNGTLMARRSWPGPDGPPTVCVGRRVLVYGVGGGSAAPWSRSSFGASRSAGSRHADAPCVVILMISTASSVCPCSAARSTRYRLNFSSILRRSRP